MLKPENVRKTRVPISTGRVFRNRNLLILDILIVAAAYFCSFFLATDVHTALSRFMLKEFLYPVMLTAVVFVVCMYVFGIYTTMWIHGGTKDYIRIIESSTVASLVSIVLNSVIFDNGAFNIKFSICAVVLASVASTLLRMSIRASHNIYKGNLISNKDSKRLMIVGAGTSAAILLKDMYSNENLNYNVVCFVDDDENKLNASISGIKVRGTRHDIPRLVKAYDVDEILIATPSASASDRKDIIEICNETECKVKILPSIDQMIGEKDMHKIMRNVQIEDLLARDSIELDNTEIESYIKGKVILVTGGGGSIGSELCRQIMRFRPEKLVILDIYENSVYDLQMELNRAYPENKPDVVIASVRDMERLKDIFKKYRPYIVFHAAAHKHVPLMENNPGEAIKNNVLGTLNVTKCADKYGVKRFVMISTDKAVNPTNVMGATKRICEMIVQRAQKTSKTEFVAVRFGNVLGSNGSVIPLFKRQIEQGGPVTVTDKRITRFFMTIPEASQLVLQAASYAKGGEIFVLDMGEPVKIYDLAKNLIRLSGYRPEKDIKIEVCGLRPGEKLYEELLMDEEGLTNTSHNKIFIGHPIDVKYDELLVIINELLDAAETDDNELIKSTIEKAVPTYTRNKQHSYA